MEKPLYAWNYLLEAYWLCESRLQEASGSNHWEPEKSFNLNVGKKFFWIICVNEFIFE